MVLHRTSGYKRAPGVLRKGIGLIRQTSQFVPVHIELFNFAQVHNFGEIRLESRIHAQRCHIFFDITRRDFLSKLDRDQPLAGIHHVIRKRRRSINFLPARNRTGT